MRVQAKVPGKLYLAGEYAVVEPGYPAVIAAVDSYLTVTIQSANLGTIHSDQQPEFYLPWHRQGQEIVGEREHSYQLITKAMEVAETFLCAKGYECQQFYQVLVESDLDDRKSGAKYGLGSSGAVTVATIEAVLAFYGYQAEPLVVYQLAVITQSKLGMKGSFGDLAASSYHGLVAYHSLDRAWLSGKMAELDLLDLLACDWQGLSIERLELPAPLQLLVGWTGSPASTEQLVSQMENHKSQAEKEIVHAQFLQATKSCVHALIEACRRGNVPGVQQAIAENRKCLQFFAEGMGLVIETPLLAQLCAIAESYGAVGKSSGAGGGDCGICLVENQAQRKSIEEAWVQAGILPLSLTIARKE